MNANRINASLTQENIDAALALVNSLLQQLPFLIDLSPDERKGMVKFGEKNRSFVVKAGALAAQHPEILPGGFSLEDMKRHVNLVETLYPIQLALANLLGKVEDTYYAAGSQAYTAALHVYTYTKAAHVANGALEDALDDLGRRFIRRSRTTDKSTAGQAVPA
ncbi:hypothetical protein [Methylococcus sp. EFPC2]|uniref:hypothetical protein n=1 Tax=Methylococcus sp. EFPC2 TaxID=2812648 RepID=UPI001967B6DE|nr:hypothetical protein [Methylococcus sp. EFPC2]QSA98937.1 hypothetical protein JWZ97_09245 [Methylococcus sp. EFPC2]